MNMMKSCEEWNTSSKSFSSNLGSINSHLPKMVELVGKNKLREKERCII
jgi:hypothetical protein